ncbi:hypothetical protein EPUL_001148, partial [Erysiphe pulchra]
MSEYPQAFRDLNLSSLDNDTLVSIASIITQRGVPETLDPERRVQKNVNNSGRAQPLAATLIRSVAKSTAVTERIAAVQDTQVVASPPAQLPVPSMDLDDEMETETESEPENDDFPSLGSTISLKKTADMLTTDENQDNCCTQKEDVSTQNSILMIKARGLLNLVGPYQEEVETQCLGAGSGFLALIPDGVSRAIWGKNIYLKYSEDPHTLKTFVQKNNSSWAAMTANENIKSSNTPIRQIQKLIPDSSLVCDVWHAPSGIAILAPTPAKAAAILQYKDLIANRFEPGLASTRDDVSIRQIAWKNKSQDSNDDIEHVRTHFPSHKAHKFPFRLQLFGLAVGIQCTQNRKPVPICEKCFGLYSTRTCAPAAAEDSGCGVYNAPINSIGAGECMKLLLETSESPNFVASDFKLRHPMWDLFTTSTSQETTALIDWEREKDLSLLNPTDVSTHNRGGTLDLAFCFLVGAKCEIPLDLHTTSDHETLVTTIPLNGELIPDNIGRLRFNSVDKDLFLKILGHRKESSSIQTEEEAEIEAEDILKTIHTALLAACTRANSKCRGTAFWNTECWEATFRYRQARRMGHLKNEKRDLRNAVKRAKREYWKSQVENLDNLPDFYKIVKWHNTASKYHTTPLKDQNEDTLVFCPEKKAELLHGVLLSRHMEC